MAVLILYPRRSLSTVLLEQEAESQGWDILRLESAEIPEPFQLEQRPCALFYTPPGCFEVSRQLNLRLLACPAYWLPKLPDKYLSRRIKLLSLGEAIQSTDSYFYKPALNKYFETGVYTGESLARNTPGFPPSFQILQSEIVKWTVEYRCFVRHRKVLTHCPYLRHGKVTRGQGDTLAAPKVELQEAAAFAQSLLDDPDIECPPAFVLDIGLIEGKSWAVIEPNECWASSIYG
ncbi:MAG: ATP-grasp domain-containing protein, partial [Planctomycetota bacterium]|nr:ATP-grasp domain-containing protein [Planctomycetota bacterium]